MLLETRMILAAVKWLSLCWMKRGAEVGVRALDADHTIKCGFILMKVFIVISSKRGHLL
jgi:hypothetical protein